MQQQSTDNATRRYRLPGFEMRLLQELQRQQNGTLFCDTLLQTEGVSIPAHGCILAALSPYLSKRLSASPTPPAGQPRQLQLQTVKAQTLVKLVGLMYSGELEVKGTVDQEDVLALARQLEVGHLLENCRTGWSEGATKVQDSYRKWENSRIPTEGWTEREGGGRRYVEMQMGMERRKDAETQAEVGELVAAESQTVDTSLTCRGRVELPASAIGPSITPSSLQPPEDMGLCNLYSPGASPRSTAGKPYDAHTASLPFVLSSSPAVSKEPSSTGPRPREGSTGPRSPVLRDRIEEVTSAGLNSANSHNTMEGKRNIGGHPTPTMRERAGTESKNPARIKLTEVVEATQISIKVKLRRRTGGDVWEVVTMSDAAGRFSPADRQSIVSALRKDDAKLIRPQTEATQDPPILTAAHPSPSPKSKTPGPPHEPLTFHKPPLHHDCTSDFELLSNDLCPPNLNTNAQLAPVSQPQASLEESDEHIEKLLEDIMMGLRILPPMSLDRDCTRSNLPQPTYEGTPATCESPFLCCSLRESGMHTTVGVVGCHGNNVGLDDTSSTDVLHSICGSDFVSAAATPCRRSESYLEGGPQSKCPHCCFSQHTNRMAHDLAICASEPHCLSTQSQTRCTSGSSVRPMARFIQDHQSSAPCHSLRSTQQCSGARCQTTLRPESQDRPDLEEARIRSVSPTVLYSSYQQVHCATGASFSQGENRAFPELTHQWEGNEMQPSHPVSLPCIEDLRLPKCLSPLAPNASVANLQPSFIQTICDDKVYQPYQKSSSLFTEKPKALQFPLGSMIYMEDTCPSSLQFTTCPPTPYRATRRKRKCCNGAKVRCKKAKVIEGTFRQSNLSPCIVSLSCNNILVNKKKEALAFLKTPNVGKPKKKSDETETMKGTHCSPGQFDVVNASKNLITTRSSLRKPGKDASPHLPVHKTSVDSVEVAKRKRGRPPKKIKTFNNSVPSSGNKSTEKGSKQMNGGMTEIKELQEKEDKPKTKYRKIRDKDLSLCGVSAPILQRSSHEEPPSQEHSYWGNPGEMRAIIPSMDLKQTSEPKDIDRDETLKKFKELIRHRHPRTCKARIRKNIESSKTQNTLNRNKAGEKSDCTIEAFEGQMDKNLAQTQVRGYGKIPNSSLLIAFDKPHNRIIRAEDKRLGTDAKNHKTYTKGQVEPQRQDQNHNEVPTESNALPSVGKSPTKTGQEDDSLDVGIDVVDSVAKAARLPEIAPLRHTVQPKEIGPQGLNRSQIEHVDLELSSKEIAFKNDEETTISCFVTKYLSRQEINSVCDEEEELVKVGVCRKGETDPFQYPNKAWQPDWSEQSASTGQSFAEIYPPQENITATSLQTPRRRHQFLDSNKVTKDSCYDQKLVDDEEVEVDILQCSPPIDFQTKHSGLEFCIMESSPEEEEEEDEGEGKEIDVTTFEAE